MKKVWIRLYGSSTYVPAHDLEVISRILFTIQTSTNIEELLHYKEQFEAWGDRFDLQEWHVMVCGRIASLLATADSAIEPLRDSGVARQHNDARQGWGPESFVARDVKEKADGYQYLGLQEVPAEKPKLNLDRYLIPKFRGIHYRKEPSSRFASNESYEFHVKLNERRKPTYSSEVYTLSANSSRSRRPRLPSNNVVPQEDLEASDDKGLSRFAAKHNLQLQDLVLPPLASDVVQRRTERLLKRARHDYKFAKGMSVPENASELHFQEQLYVNQYGKYQKHLGEMSLPGVPQISTSDSPIHAAMYAFGAKFSTAEELKGDDNSSNSSNSSNNSNSSNRSTLDAMDIDQGRVGRTAEPKKAKKRKFDEMDKDQGPASDMLIGERRITGVVGKVYIYLFTPAQLLALDPMIVPILTAAEELSIKPLQRWEVETTFYGEIPGEYLVDHQNVEIPKEEEAGYAQETNKPSGHRLRRKWSEALAKTLWQKAERLAAARGRILVPHGTLHRLLGGMDAAAQATARQQAAIQKGNLAHLRMKQAIKDQRRLKLQRLDEVRRNLQLRKQAILGDGNCLFRAIAYCVLRDESEHVRMRTQAIGHMRQHLNDFRTHNINAQYCDRMANQAEGAWDYAHWGGEPEIFALSRYLNRCIVVHSLDNPVGTRIEDHTPGGRFAPIRPDIHIFFKGGNHYDAWV